MIWDYSESCMIGVKSVGSFGVCMNNVMSVFKFFMGSVFVVVE